MRRAALGALTVTSMLARGSSDDGGESAGTTEPAGPAIRMNEVQVLGTGDVVELTREAGGPSARCNPVNAAPDCTVGAG